MQIAIVGLARSGKTTVFNTLTRGTAETGGFGGLTVNTGVVKVPDERLTRLTSVFRPKREVPADVTYVDLPAPAMAAEGAPHGDIPADQLARLRNADALLHVVRAFPDDTVPHPLLSIDPAARRRAARAGVRAGGPGRRREARREAAHLRPPRHPRRARGQRAGAGGPGAHPAGAHRGSAHPRPGARRRTRSCASGASAS